MSAADDLAALRDLAVRRGEEAALVLGAEELARRADALEGRVAQLGDQFLELVGRPIAWAA